MTPAETIQAAIDRLTKLRDAALPGPLEVDSNYPFSSDIVGLFAPDAKVYAIKAEPASDGDWDEDYDAPLDNNDAPHRPTLTLLVTLHATIDAQLAILRSAHEQFVFSSRAVSHDEPAASGMAIDLARAILGEDA